MLENNTTNSFELPALESILKLLDNLMIYDYFFYPEIN